MDANERLHSEIEERMQAEEALRQSEEKFRNIFETAPIGIGLLDLHFRFVKVNPILCRMTGYAEQELLTFTFMDLSPPEELDADLRDLHRLLQGDIQPYNMDKHFLKRMERSYGLP